MRGEGIKTGPTGGTWVCDTLPSLKWSVTCGYFMYVPRSLLLSVCLYGCLPVSVSLYLRLSQQSHTVCRPPAGNGGSWTNAQCRPSLLYPTGGLSKDYVISSRFIVVIMIIAVLLAMEVKCNEPILCKCVAPPIRLCNGPSSILYVSLLHLSLWNNTYLKHGASLYSTILFFSDILEERDCCWDYYFV